MIFDALNLIDLKNYYPVLFYAGRIDGVFDLAFAIDASEDFRSLRILTCLALFDDDLVGFRLHLHAADYGQYLLRIKTVEDHTGPLVRCIAKVLDMDAGKTELVKSVYFVGARIRGNLNDELVLDVVDDAGQELCILTVNGQDKKVILKNMDRSSLEKFVSLFLK